MTDSKKHVKTTRFGALIREAELQLIGRIAYVESGHLENGKTEVDREHGRWRGLSIWTTENPLPIYLTAEEALMLQQLLSAHQDTFKRMVLEESNALATEKERQMRPTIKEEVYFSVG